MEIFTEDKNANNSELACLLCEQEYSYNEIIDALKDNSIIKKQACILALNELKSQEDANLLIDNLTGQDGRIREACAFKINELIKFYPEFFQTPQICTIFLKGITDVNPTVCRFIIEALLWVNNKNELPKKLLEQIFYLYSKIDFDEKGVKKHVLNKLIFKLYWTLEAFIEIYPSTVDSLDFDKVLKILEFGVCFPEYTIREKIHKLLKIIKDKTFDDRLSQFEQQFQADENFYVRLTR